MRTFARATALSLVLVACTHKDGGGATLASSASAELTKPLPLPSGQTTDSWQTATTTLSPTPSSTAAAPGGGASHAATGTIAVTPHSTAIPASGSATGVPSAPPAVTTAAAATPVRYASTAASGNHFSLAVAMRTECAVGAECTGSITLTANGGYHINNEYPYKFVGDSTAGASWLASDGKSFGRATGEFQKTTDYVAVLAVRYRGTQAGSVRLSGTYKMSVCSEANCQVESVPLAVNVVFQ